MYARFYQELFDWWPLFSPPKHDLEEVNDLLRRLAPLPEPGTKTLLELGSGGGFASHLKNQFTLTLTDLSGARPMARTSWRRPRVRPSLKTLFASSGA